MYLAQSKPACSQTKASVVAVVDGTAISSVDLKNKVKYSISNPDLYPNYAILDYKLTESLPEELSLITSK